MCTALTNTTVKMTDNFNVTMAQHSQFIIMVINSINQSFIVHSVTLDLSTGYGDNFFVTSIIKEQSDITLPGILWAQNLHHFGCIEEISFSSPSKTFYCLQLFPEVSQTISILGIHGENKPNVSFSLFIFFTLIFKD